MNGKIANGPRRTTRRPAAGSRSQAPATAPVRPFCAVRRSSTRATHSSVPTRDRSAGSSGSGIAAGRSPSSRGGPPPSELMSQPLAHEGRGQPARSEWEVPPHLWRRGLAGETGFPPRERAEGERRSCGQPLLQLVEGNLDVLRPGRPDRRRGGADHHGQTRAQSAGLCQLALKRSAGVVGIGGPPGRAKAPHEGKHSLARGALVAREEDIDRLLGGGLDAGILEGEQQPLDPRAEADTRRRRAADLLREVVVATPTRDRALRAVLRPLELPGRARVVVEAAHERRRQLVRDAVGVEIAPNGVEVLPAGFAERFADLGRIDEGGLDSLALDVEDAQRRRGPLLARLVVENVLVLVEPGVEPLEVRRPAVAIADRVQLQPAYLERL